MKLVVRPQILIIQPLYIFNQLKDYVSNQLARKLDYAFVYSNISYGI